MLGICRKEADSVPCMVVIRKVYSGIQSKTQIVMYFVVI